MSIGSVIIMSGWVYASSAIAASSVTNTGVAKSKSTAIILTLLGIAVDAAFYIGIK